MKMYNIKNIILVGFALLITNIGISQLADPSINILMQPASVSLFTTGTLNVDACNEGFSPIVANSLRITITVGTNAEIMGLNAGTSDPRWTVQSLSTGAANTMILTNTSGVIAGGTCGDINIIVKGKVIGGPSNIVGNIVYIAGPNPLLPGNPPPPSSSQGNTIGNDNSTTTLTVTVFLPITLESFSGSIVNCKTELNWKTSAEDNLKNYVVEYSTDAKSFQTVGVLEGKGQNGGGSTYNYAHEAKNGLAYYRLKSVDHNGTFGYSNVINVTRACEKRTVKIYPNPSSDLMTINIDKPIYDAVNVETGILYNSAGKEVQKYSLQIGTNSVDVSKFNSGIYILQIITKDSSENFQIFIE